MDEKPKLQAYGDITIITGKYMKDGKEKNRYQRVGTLFATPHFSRISIKLDALPMGGDGWLNVFQRENSDQNKSSSDIESLANTSEQMGEDELPEGF